MWTVQIQGIFGSVQRSPDQSLGSVPFRSGGTDRRSALSNGEGTFRCRTRAFVACLRSKSALRAAKVTMSERLSQSKLVISAYRELLRFIRRLPASEQPGKLAEAGETMRKHQSETNAQKVSDLHKELVAKIGWLRVVTPRRQGDSQRIGAGNFVIRDGKLVEGQAGSKGNRVADGKVSMNEAREIHHRLLRRQYYGRDPPKSIGPF